MGNCVSRSSVSISNGEKIVGSCLGVNMSTKKRTRRTFSDHGANNLSSIPNRISTNGKSQSSCIFTQQGRKGINQDAMIVWEDFLAEDTIFCGVFDGHGPYGHLVARKVRDTLPIKLLANLQNGPTGPNGPGGSSGSASVCCKGDISSDVIDPEKEDKNVILEDKEGYLWKEAFLKSYKAMDRDLKTCPNLDCFCSGSTAITIVKQGSNLFMGSIGDSRAIMGSKDDNDSMIAIQLTVDLKPDLPKEAERIKRCKGRVFALQDEPEVQRVWLPFDDAPGLAMARAFGDFCLKEYGVISIPEFTHQVLTQNDKFIVLASDGVWDVLSNEEVVEIVSSSPNRSSVAKLVVEASAREWKTKYPTSKMDDCAVVCVFLDGKMDSESDYDEQNFSSATLQSNHSENRVDRVDSVNSVDAVDSDNDGQNSEPCLTRNFTVRSSEESGDTYKVEQDWSGLEGVTRVNSLVQLPRFSEEMPRP